MKYFTGEWWSNVMSPDTLAAFEQYDQSLHEVRKLIPQELHWVLEPCAFHDGRRIELHTDDFLSVRLSLDVDTGYESDSPLCGRVEIDFKRPTGVMWKIDAEANEIEKLDPPIDLGYHEFSKTESGLLQYNAIFASFHYAELEIVFESFDVHYTPIDFSATSDDIPEPGLEDPSPDPGGG